MVRAYRKADEENDEVAEFFDRFWDLAVEAARRKLTMGSGREPKQSEVAQALEVAPSTVGHWRKGSYFPREAMADSVLELAGATSEERFRFLAWRRRVHPLWQARRHARGRAAVSSAADASSARVTKVPLKATVAEPRGVAVPTRAGREDVAGLPDGTGERTGPAPAWGGPGPAWGGEPEGAPIPAATPRGHGGGRYDPPHEDGRRPRPAYQEEPADPLSRAADALARNVHAQWEEEAAWRGLDIPPPIPPRWIGTRRPVIGPVEVAVGDPARRVRFAALPGHTRATADLVHEGGLDELFALYAGLGSGRIVMMGGYGCGKTTTAILMLLDALDQRVGLPAGMRVRTPVPVLLAAHGWDPRRQSLGDWFAGQLATTYGFLHAPEYGPDAAAELVRGGRVALFLDGFDEMDDARRAEALRHINRRRRTFRLVVLTRTDAFATAVEAGGLPLHGAVAVELAPVSPDRAIGYLSGFRRSPARGGDELEKLIDRLRHSPDDQVSRALDTPLNLSLVREDPHAAGELLTSGRFGTRDQVEDFLLGRVVPTAYEPGREPGPDPERARRWLGYLASRMGRGDLDWWRMHHWAPAWERCLLNTLAGVALMSCVGALVFGPVGRYTVAGHTGALFGAGYGAAMGGLFGFMAALISELRDPGPGWERAIRSVVPRWARRVPWRPSRFAYSPAIGLFLFTAVTMAVGNQSGYPSGLPAGAVIAVTAGRAAMRIRVVSGVRPWWARPRPDGTDLVTALAAGLPVGLAYGLTKTPSYGVAAGLISGFTFGFMTAAARPVSDADTPPDPGTSWRRDRHRALAVGLTAGVPIGLALGVQNGHAHGPAAGIAAALGLGTIIALGSMVGISDAWRTCLLFLQLRLRGVFPLRGKRFLDDARDRGVLRAAGPRIQFRHDRLRAVLCDPRHPPAGRRDGPGGTDRSVGRE
ncbi:hypothetical protein FHS43_002027 [Streptosporangium becharense]|uniref:NACHT domain-containing protein n=1 Tax=Streptosporangium becharense TaxID=1816182 RepID=A0A7W9IB48_9ACTN|nr:hypothetical protein [Streptosporangium becharense]MBB2910764.1 hypothetical protein [Streptosporangium becharense]MBB5817459.1 hypothetical protein [Streptosporangium becharense]